ncbi:MAG: hypothetical protein LC733_13290, partial [Actinobacteria bacterium]|nr:hypothetical protein [Actinomycetota bacterium]
MNKLTRMAALVVIAGLLGACGAKGDADLTVGLPGGPAANGGGGGPAPVTDDGGPVNPGPAPPACELLTLDDLAGTLGNPVRAGSGEG